MSSSGEGFLYLVNGALTLRVGNEELHRLTHAGDPFSFQSTLHHRWRSDARLETRLLWINAPPTF